MLRIMNDNELWGNSKEVEEVQKLVDALDLGREIFRSSADHTFEEFFYGRRKDIVALKELVHEGA